MTSIFQDGALHPGLDANDAWWFVVRRLDAWEHADPRFRVEHDGTAYDPSRAVIELAPAALAPATDVPARVVDGEGAVYTVDPHGARVLRQRRCDAAPAVLPGLGGPGWSTGRLNDPAGLALDDRGFLYVADRGNRRVQVFDPARGMVIVVLENLDAPAVIAVGPSRIWIGGAGGRIDVFDRAFRRDAGFIVRRPDGTAADIVAIAADGDDAVVVADRGWSRLLRFDCRGNAAGELPFGDATSGLGGLGGLAARARFAEEGTIILGPLDGGSDQLAWHQVAVDALLPPGTSIEVQTYAVDGVAGAPTDPPPPPPPILVPATTPWAPAEPAAIPRAGVEGSDGEALRLVQSDVRLWEQHQHAPWRRSAPRIHRFTGVAPDVGPNAVATFPLPPAAAARLRANDAIELRSTGLAPEPATIASLSPRAVTVAAAGHRITYGAGTEVRLVERDGRSRDGALMGTLALGEQFDLAPFTSDGDVGDVTLAHSVAALLHPGDRLELRLGVQRATVLVDSVDGAPSTVTLTGPVTGNHHRAALHLIAPANRVVVEDSTGWAGGFPPDTQVAIDSIGAGGAIVTTLATVRWSDPATATVWLGGAALPATWFALKPAAPAATTDRGRYLWVKLRLRGPRDLAAGGAALATATPTIRALRIIAPRLSYLDYLPAVYTRRDDDDPSGALFLERYLALFEGRLTAVEARYEDVARLLNPFAADDDWLTFVGDWFDVVFDPSWPRERRALLLAEIFDLYRRRGTAAGIVRFVELYTGHRPELLEGFQVRPRPGMVLGCLGVLGCAPLGGLDVEGASSAELLARHAHRFTLVAPVDDDCDVITVAPAIRALVDAIKPAHTDVDLRVIVPQARVGLASTIGLDFVLGDERRRPAPLGTTHPWASRPAPVLGVDAVLPSLGGAALATDGGPPIGSFTIR